MLFLSLGAVPHAASGSKTEPGPEGGLPSSGSLTFFLENDLFLRLGDDNYTAGNGVSWVSVDVATYGPTRFERRVANAASFLPRMGEERFRDFVSFTLGQEMYTPNDIESSVPPPDEQPYAGVLFVDTGVYAHGRVSMHGYTLRVGCVGPCSGAAEAQRRIHRITGSPMPQGWDYQLKNELLLNASYQYNRRVARRRHQDLAVQAGGSLGNYYTGGNFGVVYRVGYHLPDTYSVASLRTGGASRFVGPGVPSSGWRGHVFIGFQVFGIARFLPTDGNTFRDGPSVDRDNFVGNLATGFVIGHGRWGVSWTRHTLTGFNELSGSRSQDFGTITLSYHFGRRAQLSSTELSPKAPK